MIIRTLKPLPFDVRRWMFDVGCSPGFMGMGIPFPRAGKSHQRVNRSEGVARFSLSLGERVGVRASVLIPLNMA